MKGGVVKLFWKAIEATIVGMIEASHAMTEFKAVDGKLCHIPAQLFNGLSLKLAENSKERNTKYLRVRLKTTIMKGVLEHLILLYFFTHDFLLFFLGSREASHATRYNLARTPGQAVTLESPRDR
ncbi:MAG: hypothetical protein PVS3B3_27720 [Ktedonobacteraceae bacterium]